LFENNLVFISDNKLRFISDNNMAVFQVINFCQLTLILPKIKGKTMLNLLFEIKP